MATHLAHPLEQVAYVLNAAIARNHFHNGLLTLLCTGPAGLFRQALRTLARRPSLAAPETRGLSLLDFMHHVFALALAAGNFVVIGIHVDVFTHGLPRIALP
jgi:hypothetical protein